VCERGLALVLRYEPRCARHCERLSDLGRQSLESASDFLLDITTEQQPVSAEVLAGQVTPRGMLGVVAGHRTGRYSGQVYW
jgi:hypothetical protein